MIFKRREKPRTIHRVREFMYPRKGFWRGFGYIGKRMRRLPDTPHRIALGFACGAFASFSPFFTLHFFFAAFCAWVMRGNIIASLFGTIVGNPISFPAIAASCLWLGRVVLGRKDDGSDFDAVMKAFGEGATAVWGSVKSLFGPGHSDLHGIVEFLDVVFLPYLIGGVLLGLPAAFVSYWLVGSVVAAYQARRQRKFDELAAKRRRMADAEQEAYATHDGQEGDNA